MKYLRFPANPTLDPWGFVDMYVHRLAPRVQYIDPEVPLQTLLSKPMKLDIRISFTQYAAGGLFHWVKNGFCSDKTFVEKATKNQLREREEARIPGKCVGRMELGCFLSYQSSRWRGISLLGSNVGHFIC